MVSSRDREMRPWPPQPILVHVDVVMGGFLVGEVPWASSLCIKDRYVVANNSEDGPDI